MRRRMVIIVLPFIILPGCLRPVDKFNGDPAAITEESNDIRSSEQGSNDALADNREASPPVSNDVVPSVSSQLREQELDDVVIETFPTWFHFQPSWVDSGSLTYSRLSDREASTAASALRVAMQRYPRVMLRDIIDGIVLFKNVSLYNKELGILHEPERKRLLFVTGPSDSEQQLFIRVQSLFHRMVAHAVFLRHKSQFPVSAWNEVNPPEFQYGKGAIQEIREKRDLGFVATDDLLVCGFIGQYSQYGMQEDFSAVAEILMMHPEWAADARRAYPRVGKKIDLALKFYQSCYPRFISPL